MGKVGDHQIYKFTMANSSGMKVEILSYGGTVQALEFPDRDGRPSNIVLGFRTLQEYVDHNPLRGSANAGRGVYFGSLVGRYANRLAGGNFRVDGRACRVPANEGPNALHGGSTGFDQKAWEPTITKSDEEVSLHLEYSSPDGEMGFPGNLRTCATYKLGNDNRLTLVLEASTDAPTVVSLTNHTYWDLAGEAAGPVYDQLLYINADGYTPVDKALIPTGEIRDVSGTPFDFRTLKPIGERIRDEDPQLGFGRGYDHNWVLRQTSPRSLVLAATAVDLRSGRRLDVRTTQPGLQFYSGNFLDGSLVGSGGRAYRQSDGFALETQAFPDSPNHPQFPSAELRPGENYQETTTFSLSCAD